jgi:hypothetical protein
VVCVVCLGDVLPVLKVREYGLLDTTIEATSDYCCPTYLSLNTTNRGGEIA